MLADADCGAIARRQTVAQHDTGCPGGTGSSNVAPRAVAAAHRIVSGAIRHRGSVHPVQDVPGQNEGTQTREDRWARQSNGYPRPQWK